MEVTRYYRPGFFFESWRPWVRPDNYFDTGGIIPLNFNFCEDSRPSEELFSGFIQAGIITPSLHQVRKAEVSA
jgi:hypothetical protein